MPATLDLWVYRDSKRRERGARVIEGLLRRVGDVDAAHGEAQRRLAVEALVLAGELEAALADAGAPGVPTIAALTDALASISLGGTLALTAAAAEVRAVAVPDLVAMSPPEGFAYYALAPEAYAYAALDLAADDVLVVGIRSIGTTLSAVVRAALLARGVRAERITVRPTGHPFSRHVESFARPRDGVTVLVVDEGPGLSGSTLLATAEAAVRAGVPPDRVVILCSRPVDPSRLVATDAARRWRTFRTIVAPANVRAPAGGIDLSDGAWRCLHYADHDAWPASYGERPKFLIDERHLLKFEGLGSSGAAARSRAMALAAERIAPPATDTGDGWVAYPWAGRPLDSRNVDASLIEHLGTVCARRRELFTSTEATDLGPVIAKNAAVLLDIPSLPPIHLDVTRATIVDGRMAPHEWIRDDRGTVLKTDAVAHGDDHFFPGPTDIAGAIIEWQLDARSCACLLDVYRRRSGDDVDPRLGRWLFAYAICRAAYLAFAAEMVRGSAEEGRFTRELARHLWAARRQLPLALTGK